MLKSKKIKTIAIIALIIIYLIYLIISLRGEYLQILELGSNYISIYEHRIKYKAIVTASIFLFIYALVYVSTIITKNGLKKFFKEDNIDFPKLPNAIFALGLAIIGSILLSKGITEKILLAMNGTWFGGDPDPIFHLDIGYYIFKKPLIELLLKDFINIIIAITIYIACYYIIVFNKYLDKGINPETLKKNTFIKQLTVNALLIIITISALTLVNIQNSVVSEFLTLNDGTSLIGAGLKDTTIKAWGYRIFSILIIVAVFMGLTYTRRMNFKKAIKWLAVIPIYLVGMMLVILIFNLTFIGNNALDKEKTYIEYNMDFTKKAYNINNEIIEKTNSGTITNEDIEQNSKIIDNINLINEDVTLSNLKEYKTNSGYYTFNNTKVGLYNINGEEKLVYITPREIIGNETRTYNNKTYEYTHGYGIVMTDASTTDKNGNINYIQDEIEQESNTITIEQPRIYFGLETNHYIVTNAKNKEEYDYPLTTGQEATEYSYEGETGLNLGFLDRLILGIKEKNISLAFSTNISKESKIITDRNIIERAKILLPNIIYDENPYMIITDEGKLLWVLDGYTISNKYPYSQMSTMEYNKEKIEFNYIRNSLKVIINPYDGTMNFYITDRSDPIIMAYRNMYPDLFEDKDNEIPENISKHFVYPKMLYSIQCNMLEKYHNTQAEVLYRCDDSWEIANKNTNTNTKISGIEIEPYYTMVKTENGEYKIGLVVPYTISGKQNIISYLVGVCNGSNNNLKLYRFNSNEAIMGPIQLDTLISQDETISKKIENLNTTGTKLQKSIVAIPIGNTLLYVEPIYQVSLNEESKVPVLKKVIVASGNKIAIGDNFRIALNNLLSKEAVSVDIEEENLDKLIKQIINANNNLEESTKGNDWKMIGNDLEKLQNLIKQLEEVKSSEDKNKQNKVEVNEIIEQNIE